MPLGTEVGLGPGDIQADIVLDVNQAPPKGAQPLILGAHVRLLWQTAGWIKMPLGTEVDFGPGHTVLDWDPAPLAKGAQQLLPLFSAISVVAKRSPISATAEHLLLLTAASI